MKDYVYCCNCNKVQLVDIGSDQCLFCNEEGFLSWVDPNKPEVEDDFID